MALSSVSETNEINIFVEQQERNNRIQFHIKTLKEYYRYGGDIRERNRRNVFYVE
jgi:hypothetical protein